MAPAARRDAIVEAALAVALRKGFASTTVRDVATELHCSSGLIHHYFASMDEVLAAAFERAAGRDLADTEAAVAEATTPEGRLSAFFGSYARADQDWSYQLWLDAWADAVRRPALGDTSRRLNTAWQQLVVRIIRDGVVAGAFHCADPDATAWRLLSLLDGLSLQAVAHRGLIDRATVLAWAIAAAEDELHLDRGSLPRPITSPVTSPVTSPGAG
jgi:AcrR family transcriptional regulator